MKQVTHKFAARTVQNNVKVVAPSLANILFSYKNIYQGREIVGHEKKIAHKNITQQKKEFYGVLFMLI